MELVKHLSWSFLQKELAAYRRKQFPQKNPPYMFERVLNNTNFYFNESYTRPPPIINTSFKSIFDAEYQPPY